MKLYSFLGGDSKTFYVALSFSCKMPPASLTLDCCLTHQADQAIKEQFNTNVAYKLPLWTCGKFVSPLNNTSGDFPFGITLETNSTPLSVKSIYSDVPYDFEIYGNSICFEYNSTSRVTVKCDNTGNIMKAIRLNFFTRIEGDCGKYQIQCTSLESLYIWISHLEELLKNRLLHDEQQTFSITYLGELPTLAMISEVETTLETQREVNDEIIDCEKRLVTRDLVKFQEKVIEKINLNGELELELSKYLTKLGKIENGDFQRFIMLLETLQEYISQIELLRERRNKLQLKIGCCAALFLLLIKYQSGAKIDAAFTSLLMSRIEEGFNVVDFLTTTTKYFEESVMLLPFFPLINM